MRLNHFWFSLIFYIIFAEISKPFKLYMFVSIILSTYNQPAWLAKVLYGYSLQSYTDFEIVIADDGSGKETFKVIEQYQKESHLKIKHVWHEDDGFRKCTILNKAILASDGEYLIFSDGDCIPRADFVDTHVKYSQKGYFLSGGMYRLTMDVSHSISLEDIKLQKCFDITYLHRLEQKKSFFKDLKCSSPTWLAKTLNSLTPTRASWNGHNSSGWKTDILETRGFDERMKYGGEDREMGERLINSGLKSKQIRYSAICIHLEHSRGYVSDEDWQRNYQIRKETKENKTKQTKFGIKI